MIEVSYDILSNPRLTGALYWLPALALIVSGFLDIDQFWRTIIWTAALSVMAGACIVNALRCGRVHCYLSGPFLLIMAVFVLSRGIQPAPLGERGWNMLGLTVLVGILVLWFVPERFLGRYRKMRAIGRPRAGPRGRAPGAG